MGLKVLGMASVQAVQKRRLDLQVHLSGAAKELAEANQPFDDTLFGRNLKQHFTNILAANKITSKMASPRALKGKRFHPFLGRGRGRRRSFSNDFHGFDKGHHQGGAWQRHQHQDHHPRGQQHHHVPRNSTPHPFPQKRGRSRGQGPSTPRK